MNPGSVRTLPPGLSPPVDGGVRGHRPGAHPPAVENISTAGGAVRLDGGTAGRTGPLLHGRTGQAGWA